MSSVADSVATSDMKLAFERAVQLHQAGDFTAAGEIYEDVLRGQPTHVGANHLRGVALHQQGKHEAALAFIEQAIRLDGRQAVFFNNFGAALQALGRGVEALGAFQVAVTLRPKYVDALSNLGHAWEQIGNFAAAESALLQALEREPLHRDSLSRLAKLLVRRGRRRDAADIYQRLLGQVPEQTEYLLELAGCWLADNNPQKAAPLYRKVTELLPNNAAARFNLGSALADQDCIEEARAEFDHASRLAPHRHAWSLRSLVLCPAACASVERLDGYRGDLEARLDRLLEDSPPIDPEELMAMSFFPPFALAFQGRFDRPIKEKFAALVRRWIQPHQGAGSGGQPRVGFVVTRGHEGLFLRCMAGIIERLDPDKLDVQMICTESSVDKLQRGIARPGLKYVPLPERLGEAATRVEQARCDLLYFWEVGSDALNYLLPFYRLAPLQVTSWGTQVTSGVAEIDYYLASALAELPEADTFYTESLWRLPGLLTFQRRIAPPPPTSKSYFGIDEAQRMYLCPQTVLKLHPEQDSLFGELLRADPQGVLFLKSGKHIRSLEVIQARMARALPDVYDRIRFVPWQTMGDHHRLVAIADVVLDPLYFGAGSSSYDMWSLNQPLISIPGTYHIGRYSQACYRKMGWTELVANSPAEYVGLATRVARDADYRREARGQLEARTPDLFERADSVRELEECLIEMIEQRRSATAMP